MNDVFEWLDKLPLVLAGPYLRRVESGLVSVWVATREPCEVTLSVFPGRVSRGAPAPLATSTMRTLRVGAKLHVACVVADVALSPDHLYSYDLAFEHAGGRDDLHGLGLLRNATGTEPPHLPLGYEDDLLPSFATTPSAIEHLVLAHGSCRRPGALGPDALAFLDDRIGTVHEDAQRRPHQLFLTGDQIYADDVAKPLLPLCTTLGHYLLSGVIPAVSADPLAPGSYPIVTALEHLATSYKPDPVPATHGNLTSVWRRWLVEREAKLTTLDMESHLLSLGEFLGMYLLTFSTAVWPRGLDRWFAEAESVVTKPSDAAIPSQLAGPPVPPSAREPIIDDPTDEELAEQRKSYRRQVPALEELRQALPRVQRALANVPTYMILDDHEVTDDWNITDEWVRAINGNPLGRAVLRNGLVAYAVFQAWGSDPRYFASDQPGGSVLAQITNLFPDGLAQPPAAAAVAELDRLFGLTGAPSQVRWDWKVDGARHRVVALDARTRRAFVGPTAPPIIVPPAEIDRQIPEGPLPSGLEVLVVLAPSPTVSLPLRDDFVQPFFVRQLDVTYAHAQAKRRKPNAPPARIRDARHVPGSLDKDFESWFVDPWTLEYLLRRLATYPRVVVLSGDVHHASSSSLSYWRRGHAEPSRLASFTSSGLKNHAPAEIAGTVKILALVERAWHVFTPFERLVWDQDFPRPIEVPPELPMPRALRAKLRTAPVIVPSVGWPPEAQLQREPDSSWRLRVIRDERPVAELPPAARTLALEADLDPAGGTAGYSTLARRHQTALASEALTRTSMFMHNLGVVTFAREWETAPLPEVHDDSIEVPTREVLVVRHNLYAIHPTATPTDAADAYAVHRVVLDPFPFELPPTIVPEETPP